MIRIWKSRDGKEASAKFVRIDSITGKIVVENDQGREFRIPLNVLSDEDVAYIESIQ